MAEHQLDCRNLKCPMPIVQLALKIRGVQVGDFVHVAATDPAFLADVRAWSRMTGQGIEEVGDGDVKQVRVHKVKA